MLLLVAVTALKAATPTAAEGGRVPSSGGLLKPLGLGEAWTLVEVWREVLKSWAAWVMKGWIERALVEFHQLLEPLPARTERPDQRRGGPFGRSFGR